jgi:hypothetical protein
MNYGGDPRFARLLERRACVRNRYLAPNNRTARDSAIQRAAHLRRFVIVDLHLR